MRYGFCFALCFALIVSVGCGGKEPPATNISANGTAGTNAKGEAPDVIVTHFLNSLAKGDDALATSLLTAKARAAIAENELQVSKIGMTGMSYQLGQTEMSQENEAHVGCIWSQKQEDGTVASFDSIWVLRMEPQGWRVSGMAVPGEQPNTTDYVDFENGKALSDKVNVGHKNLAEGAQDVPPQNLPMGEQPAIENAQKPDVNPLR